MQDVVHVIITANKDFESKSMPDDLSGFDESINLAIRQIKRAWYGFPPELPRLSDRLRHVLFCPLTRGANEHQTKPSTTTGTDSG